jgi:serine/threonine protein kinase
MLGDIWAVGIILFISLTGFPPMEYATPADQRYCKIVAGGLRELVVDSWELELSDSVIDLLQGIFRAEPERRLSVSQIMDHPWLST